MSNNRWRISTLQQEDRANRRSSSRRRVVSLQDAYSYALRVAYLSYLLQPRARRMQQVAAPKQLHRSSTSVTDLVKDFSLIRDSKSTKFPHGFMKELDKRLTGVLVGREKMPEYNDPQIKSTFAGFLNEFKDPKFRKTMEENRRVEDLLLIFFSNATKIMQRGKTPDDDSWRLMVDRHVALFIRLISSTLRNHDWSRDRPELTSRLTTMEKKLLMHDQDLAAASQRNGGSGSTSIEVEVPRSYEVKDMPLVLVVSRIFNVPYDTVQQDINAKKDVWTEKAALQDLKAYQANLSLTTRQTLSPDDFDTEDAYDLWKKAENQDLSQMMLAIIQSNPELAKSTAASSLPQFKPDRGSSSDSGYSEMSRKMSEASEIGSYVIDQPVDMSALNLNDLPSPTEDGSTPYTYIPPEPRAYYRAIVKQALTYDLQDEGLDPSSPTGETQAIKLLSRDSTELLSEIGLRCRIPQFSRLVIFLDVIKEKYQQQELSLEQLDDAFTFVKQPPIENNRKGNRSSVMMLQTSMFDHTKWTVHDFILKQQVLSGLHDDLLRELYQLMLFCYDSKPPTLGPVMFVLNNHIYEDALFTGTPEDLDEYSTKLSEALGKRAAEVYSEILAKIIPDTKDEWEFFHVIELGKAVIKLCEKIQKRYRKNPEIMGVNPLNVLVHEILPSYAADARDLVAKIMEYSAQKGDELPIQDGFDLYKELVEIRRIHADALPE